MILNNDGSTSRATVALSSGLLVSLEFLPGTSGAAFAQGSVLISHGQKGLTVETASGFRESVTVPGDATIERMSSEWLHLSSASTKQSWALHVAASQVELFVLPTAQMREEIAK
jgi:hypothetical protein